MSNTLVYGGAVVIFIAQLLCCLSENRIIKNLPFIIVTLPACVGVGYWLFYKIRNPWKVFVTAVYVYVTLVWLASALLARMVYRLINRKNKKSG